MLDDIVSFLYNRFKKKTKNKYHFCDEYSVYNLCFDTSAFIKVEFWYGLFNRQVESCQATLIFFFFFCTSCAALNSLFPTGWNWHLQAGRTRLEWWVKRRPLNGAMGVDGVRSDRLLQSVEASVPESVCIIENQGLTIHKEHVGREMRRHHETTSIIPTGQNILSGENNTVGLVRPVRSICAYKLDLRWTLPWKAGTGDAVHRWPREMWLTLLRADVPRAILRSEHEWYSYCIPGCRPKSNSTKPNTIITENWFFRFLHTKTVTKYPQPHTSRVNIVIPSTDDTSYTDTYRYVGISVNMATQLWVK